jgi:hypothetical protein
MQRNYLTVILCITGFIVQIIGYIFDGDFFIKAIFMVFGLMFGIPALIILVFYALRLHFKKYIERMALLYISVILSLDLILILEILISTEPSPINVTAVIKSIPLLICWNLSGILWLIGTIIYQY